jgi:hypothetical protein
VEGIDYEDAFAHVARYTSIPDDYFPCNIHGLESTSDGCKENLSQWRDEEEVYIEHPDGFVIHEKEFMCAG